MGNQVVFQKTEFGFDLCGLVAILADFLGYHLRLAHRGNFSNGWLALWLQDIKQYVVGRLIFKGRLPWPYCEPLKFGQDMVNLGHIYSSSLSWAFAARAPCSTIALLKEESSQEQPNPSLWCAMEEHKSAVFANRTLYPFPCSQVQKFLLPQQCCCTDSLVS